MATKRIVVRQNTTATLLTFKLTTFRNEASPKTVVDITGYAFYLIVKPDADLADSRAFFDLAGSIVTAAEGTFRFTLTSAHTCLAPGTWPGEIRWFSGGAPATGTPPTDAWSVDYVVEQAIDNVA